MLNNIWIFSNLQQHTMWRISNIVTVLLLATLIAGSYLEFPLVRSNLDKKHFEHAPVVCKNETTLNQDAQYHQICYQKDISYSIPFIYNDNHFFMAVDLTIPIGWVKSPECKIQGSDRKCHRIIQTLTEEVRAFKKKISNKLHRKKQAQLKQDAIIEGSSSIIRGEVQKSRNISFIAKDSSRLNNFFELIMLGLFIYGEKDHLELVSTNFVNATEISENLDALSDGAISLRFDQTSQNSFLNEIFAYVKATEKTVTLFLGLNNTITIGDMTAKYTETGYSSIQWIDMPEDESFGKLPRLKDIGMQDREQDSEGQVAQQLTAVFSLSASYIGLPEAAFTAVFGKFMSKEIKCDINNNTYYVECTAASKKKFEKLKEKSIFFSFEGKNINVKLQKLVLEQQSKRLILNIKKSFNNRVILGQPIFLEHFIALDYSKNKIGFAPKRTGFNQFFVDVVSLVRFLCLIMIIGCSLVFCYGPCQKIFKFVQNKNWKASAQGTEGRRLKQYSPIQQNPYEDLKGKIQEVLGAQKDVQGI